MRKRGGGGGLLGVGGFGLGGLLGSLAGQVKWMRPVMTVRSWSNVRDKTT